MAIGYYAANARLRSAAIGHARELVQVQAAVAALRGELRSRDAEIAEQKRARMHVSAGDVGELAVPRGSGGGGGGGCGGGASTHMPCTRCSAKVKPEKDGVGEQLAGKGEL
jgi:hypothetical protein